MEHILEIVFPGVTSNVQISFGRATDIPPIAEASLQPFSNPALTAVSDLMSYLLS